MATFGTFTAGQVLTAAELNGAGAWQDYTPSWTQSATISKTVNWARYSQFNKIVMGSVKMTATSAGTASNKILVGLPVAASSNNFVMGIYNYVDSGAIILLNNAAFSVFYETSTTVSLGWRSPTSNSGWYAETDVRLGQADGTRGSITVASGDVIYIQFMYEAA